MFESSAPLASAPMTGTVCSVDLVARTCVVALSSTVVDGVTWSGPDPIQDQSVYLTDMGDRLVIVSALDSEMHWVPYTLPEQEWRAGDVTRDGQWLMVATNDTNDRPSPTLIGTAGWYTSTTPTQTTVSAIMVTCGNRYTAAQSGVVDRWRAYVDSDQIVTAWLIRDPEGAAIRYELGRWAFYAAGWQAFSLATPLLIQAGETFDLVVLIERIMMRTMAVEDSWDYSRVNEIAPAGSGQILHSRWLPDLISVSKMDANSVDHSTALEAVTFGYRVEIGGTEYMVLDATNEGDSILLQVNPVTFKKGGTYILKVGPTSAGSTKYRATSSGWPAIPSGGDLDGQGFYSTTGGYSDAIATLTDTRYGVDVHWQAGDVSPDWDVLALAAAPGGTYVRTAGDTMTGALVLPSDPTNALEAAPKQYVDTGDALRLPLTGGTISGNLTVTKASPSLILNAAASGQNRYVYARTDGVNRWVAGANSDAESGSNAGSNYLIYRYADDGAALGTALQVSRATGLVTIPGGADIKPKAGAIRQLWRNTDTSIANSTWTLLTTGWYTTTLDGGNSGIFPYSGGIITIGEAGVYDVFLYASFDANATGQRCVELMVNGSMMFRDGRNSVGSTYNTMCPLSVISQYFTTGTTLQWRVYQNSGGALLLGGSSRWNLRKVADA